jgi:hypothetical protein
MGSFFQDGRKIALNPYWVQVPNGEMDHVTYRYATMKVPKSRLEPPQVTLVDPAAGKLSFKPNKAFPEQVVGITYPEVTGGGHDFTEPLTNNNSHSETIFPKPLVQPDGQPYPIGQNLIS